MMMTVVSLMLFLLGTAQQLLVHDKEAVLLEERRRLQESSLTRWQYSAVGWEVL